jgi:hypothetical protein
MTAIEIADLLYTIKNEHVAMASLSLFFTFNKFIEKDRVLKNYLKFYVISNCDSTV